MMMKKYLAVIMIAALALASMAGCSAQGGESTKPTPDAADAVDMEDAADTADVESESDAENTTDTEDTPEMTDTPEIGDISGMGIGTMPAGTPAYARHDAVVQEVTGEGLLLNIGEEQPETAFISDETVFLTAAGETTDVSALGEGDMVSVFVDAQTPVPLIYPAQYPASYVVLGDGENYAGVDIDLYGESDSLGMYLNGAKTLAINVDENTSIVTVSGSKIYIDYTDLAGRKLAVFYNMMTMSLPPIANPTQVIVLD